MSDKIIDMDRILDHPKLVFKNQALWIKNIIDRINDNKNFLCVVVGQTGSGKSLSAIAAAEIIDPNFSVKQISFTPTEFLKLINSNLPKGSVIVFDEAGLAMGKRDWYSEANKDLIKLLQLFRYQNLIVFFTVPSLDFIDSGSQKLLHSEWMMVKIDKSNKKSIIKPFQIVVDPRTGVKMQNYLVVWDRDGTKQKIKYINFRKPTVALVNAYEKKKEKFADDFYKELIGKYDKAADPAKQIEFVGVEIQIKDIIKDDPNISGAKLGKKIGLSPVAAGRAKKKVLDKLAELEYYKKQKQKGK